MRLLPAPSRRRHAQLLLGLLCLSAAAAKDYYVSPTGDDAGPGSLAAPFRSLQRAADLAEPGDTVHLRAGLHQHHPDPDSNTIVRLLRDGAEGRPITFTNYFNPETKAYEDAVLQTYVEAPSGATEGYTRLFDTAILVAAKWIRLEHLAIRGSRSTISLEEARRYERHVPRDPAFPAHARRRMHQKGIQITYYRGQIAGHVTVNRCIVQECSTTAIGINTGGQKELSPQDIVISNNIVRENNQRNNLGSSAINVFLARNDGNTRTQVTIEGNDIYHNENMLIWARARKGPDGKELQDANGAPVLSDFNQGYSDGSGIIVDHSFEFTGRVVIRNNLVRENGAAGVCITGAPHVDIVNNTIYRNARSPHLRWANITLVQPQTRDIVVRDNISFARAEQPVFFGKTDGIDEVSFAGNVHFREGVSALPGTNRWTTVPAGDRYQDPGFIDAAGGDFRLRPDSPAKGKGADVANFTLPSIPPSLR